MRYHRSNEAPPGSLSGRVDRRHFCCDWGPSPDSAALAGRTCLRFSRSLG